MVEIPVTGFGCVPEVKRIGKVPARTNEDTEDEDEDLGFSIFVRYIRTLR